MDRTRIVADRPLRPFLRLAAMFFALAACGSTALAQDALLDDARARLAAGDAAGAYALLLPAEAQRAGEPGYDYLLGVAALDAGKATAAVFALERVVSLEPDNTPARAELARAYAALREFESARSELETVRASQVPDQARAQVERFLGAVDSAISRAHTQVRGYLALGGGYDSNVNSATSDTAVALPVFGGALFRLNPGAVGQGDRFIKGAGGVSVRHQLRPDLALNAGFDGNAYKMDDLSQFQTQTMAGYGGLDFRRNDYVYSVALQGEHFRLDGDSYRNTFGVLGQLRRPVDAVSQVTGYAQALRLSYPSQSIRDANRYTVGGAYARSLGGAYSPVVYAGAYLGMEDERHDGVPHLGHKFVGARAGLALNATHDLTLSASASIEHRNYGGVDPLFLVGRDGVSYNLRLAADWKPAPLWTVTPAVELTRVNSNVPINEYGRGVVSVTVRRDFN